MDALLTNVTAATISSSFTVTGLTGLTCDGLQNDEFIVVEVEKLDGSFQSLACGTTILLSKNNNTMALTAPGVYRLNLRVDPDNPVSAGFTA